MRQSAYDLIAFRVLMQAHYARIATFAPAPVFLAI